ncbi:MAG: bacteriorhodopsin [Amnibacterium sp.]
MIQPPWTAPLTQAQHDLVLFGLVATGLTLFATLVRVRFTARESAGAYRAASLTASGVVAIAFIAYLGVTLAFVFGYRTTGTLGSLVYEPLPIARYAWALRYMDWSATVPLLVIELVSISSLNARALWWTRRIGMISAVAMIGSGFLGAFIVTTGRSSFTYTLFGLIGAVFFGVLYLLFFRAMLASLPRLPEAARSSYRSAIVLLLSTWLLYPIVYGMCGVFAGGAVAVISQLAFCAADLIAKVGFGGLVHRTAVLLSRNQEDLDPGRPRRSRAPLNDSVYISDTRDVVSDRE